MEKEVYQIQLERPERMENEQAGRMEVYCKSFRKAGVKSSGKKEQ